VLADPLIRRRTLPPEVQWGRLTIDDWPIRTALWNAPADAPGSLLFVGGRADFIEKYSEAYWTWVADWKLGLATFDWRGQGLSGRMGGDSHRGHGDFERWIRDLDAVVAWFTSTLPGPHYAVAHSMGGHLMLRHLASGRRSIDRAVLLAPMLGIRTGPIPPSTARRLADAAVRLGFGRRYGLLQRGYGRWQQRPERQDLLTGCPDRFADEHWWIANNPGLALGGVTWGWLAGANRSIDALFADHGLEAVRTPLLMLAGERERLVDVEAMARAADRLPDCRFRLVPEGRHELLRETDEVRLAAQEAIRGFLMEPLS
jgi:lysophospholipase